MPISARKAVPRFSSASCNQRSIVIAKSIQPHQRRTWSKQTPITHTMNLYSPPCPPGSSQRPLRLQAIVRPPNPAVRSACQGCLRVPSACPSPSKPGCAPQATPSPAHRTCSQFQRPTRSRSRATSSRQHLPVPGFHAGSPHPVKPGALPSGARGQARKGHRGPPRSARLTLSWSHRTLLRFSSGARFLSRPISSSKSWAAEIMVSAARSVGQSAWPPLPPPRSFTYNAPNPRRS